MFWSKTDMDRFPGRNPELTRSFKDVVNCCLVAQINMMAFA
jgi:hypothetical protein